MNSFRWTPPRGIHLLTSSAKGGVGDRRGGRGGRGSMKTLRWGPPRGIHLLTSLATGAGEARREDRGWRGSMNTFRWAPRRGESTSSPRWLRGFVRLEEGMAAGVVA